MEYRETSQASRSMPESAVLRPYQAQTDGQQLAKIAKDCITSMLQSDQHGGDFAGNFATVNCCAIGCQPPQFRVRTEEQSRSLRTQQGRSLCLRNAMSSRRPCGVTRIWHQVSKPGLNTLQPAEQKNAFITALVKGTGVHTCML